MKRTILIVDDVPLNRDVLADIFEEDYEVITAADGNEAISVLDEKTGKIAALLLDIYMPGKDGFEVLKHMRSNHMLTQIPVLMITTECSLDTEKQCLDLGAMDFIKKPFNAQLVFARVQNAVSLYSYKRNLEKKVHIQTARLKKINHCIVGMLGGLVESRNLESGEHVQRVSGYTKALAQKMMKLYPEYKLTEERIEIISEAAALHDVGKIAISDTILLKPGRLTDDEFATMKTHTTLGAEYISSITDVWDEEYSKVSYQIAKYHHERYDGHGYPEGLSGDDIPLAAQLVSIADVYDALIHERCYKKAFSKDEAFKMIMNGECGTFSPKLLECFKGCFPFGNK